MFDQIGADYNERPLKYEDISGPLPDLHGVAAPQLNNHENPNALEFYSDTQTPYGPLDTNDSRPDLQHTSQQEIDEDQLINVRIRTTKTTPKHGGDDDELPRQFFLDNFQTGAQGHRLAGQLITSEFKEATRSVENFIDEHAQLLDSGMLQEYQNEAMLPMILQNHTHIDESSWNSKSHFRTSQDKASQDKSNSNSFQPHMQKELQQLEKSNRKLKQRGEQYQKLFAELKQAQRENEVPDDRSSHSKKSARRSTRTGRDSENVIRNYATSGSSAAQLKAQKKGKQSRENSSSLMS